MRQRQFRDTKKEVVKTNKYGNDRALETATEQQ